jgi:hypothetical protein
MKGDRSCSLVVRVPGYRSRGPGSVPGATREVVGLERGPLSLVSTIEELLGRNSGEITAVGIRRADYAKPLYTQNLALTLPTSGGRSVSIVRSQTQAMEFSF